jgi:ribosomal protein S18 acetylase RimI-like enzyme
MDLRRCLGYDPMGSTLDSPVWWSLVGPHAEFAEGSALAKRYRADVAPFVAVAPGRVDTWDELAALVGPGRQVLLPGELPGLPADWERTGGVEGVQLVGTAALAGAPDPEAVLLGPADVPEMLDLVVRTKPGPFLPGTHRLGTYLGIRRGGALIAMAGERLHLPGWSEVSAVCTDPAYRGQGLAARLIGAVTDVIRGRGEQPFLHAAETNTGALRLYQALGFEQRRPMSFTVLRTPG